MRVGSVWGRPVPGLPATTQWRVSKCVRPGCSVEKTLYRGEGKTHFSHLSSQAPKTVVTRRVVSPEGAEPDFPCQGLDRGHLGRNEE